ncbi:hypothetical protein DFH08DRAFT_805759 [Mycena albidolilacea]|uniref:Uncharacterized protein n=1 Tax=Mycena albidolilacea TaxID=1033008 RepID=A0AAD7A9E7_9AGAR|nr:hypothetical protein DFH08DRAFT_805759 [Mycena albidolilacea]
MASQQWHICPQVVPYVIAEPYKPPQWEKLFLPSDFTEILGAEELKLRQGEANEVLHSLCEHIQHRQALIPHKNACSNVVHGQEKNTHAVQRIKDVQTKIQSYVHKYRQAHTAIIALGCNPHVISVSEKAGERRKARRTEMAGSDTTKKTFIVKTPKERPEQIGKCMVVTPQDPKFGFPELRDEDLYTKNVDQPHNLGDGGKVEELIIIQQHNYVDMEGWQEVEILAQEFHHAIQGFNKMETVWTALVHDH